VSISSKAIDYFVSLITNCASKPLSFMDLMKHNTNPPGPAVSYLLLGYLCFSNEDMNYFEVANAASKTTLLNRILDQKSFGYIIKLHLYLKLFKCTEEFLQVASFKSWESFRAELPNHVTSNDNSDTF